MAVHPNSVIDASLADLDPEVYESLTDKENYCYTQSSYLGTMQDSDGMGTMVEITESHLISWYSPYFTEFMAAIDAWKEFDRKLGMFSLVSISYAFYSLNKSYGVGTEDDMSTASDVFFKGVFDTIKDNPVSYFDDITDPFDLAAVPPEDPEAFDGPGTAANLEAAIAEMYLAPEGEEARIREAEGKMQPQLLSHGMSSMFDEPVATGAPPSKDEQTQKILVDLGFGAVIRATGVDLPLPAGA